jgi:hypothetical protein
MDVRQDTSSISATTQRPTLRQASRLSLVHVGWIIVVAFDVVLFLPSLPLYYVLVHIPCASTSLVGCAVGQLPPGGLLALSRLGVSQDAYAAAVLAVMAGASLICFAIGGLIAWRKWQEGSGLFVSLLLITFGATGIADALLGSLQLLPFFLGALLHGLFSPLINAIVALQWPALAAFLLTFPTGRFAPRWTWLMLVPWLATELAFVLAAPRSLALAVIFISLVGTFFVQVYRYRRVYGPVQQLQTKWLVLAIGGAIAVIASISAIQALIPPLRAADSPFRILVSVESIFFFVPVVLAVGIALLRYRLYDIDIIINRALVYGTLTLSLAAVYFAVVVVVQRLVGYVLSQESSSFAIVVSTLCIAALFQPLRRAIQTAIDRRFYRRRYDAAKTLEEFNASLRSEVDLTQLSEQLLAVADETMQPAHVSLWLRPPERRDHLE